MSALCSYEIVSVNGAHVGFDVRLAHPDASRLVPVDERRRAGVLLALFAGFVASLPDPDAIRLHRRLAYDPADAEIAHPDRVAQYLRSVREVAHDPGNRVDHGAPPWPSWRFDLEFTHERWAEGLAPGLRAANALDFSLDAWGAHEGPPLADIALLEAGGDRWGVELRWRPERADEVDATLESLEALGTACVLSLVDHAYAFDGVDSALRARLPEAHDRDGYRFADVQVVRTTELTERADGRVLLALSLAEPSWVEGLSRGTSALLW